MLGPFATASRRTPIHQVSLPELSHDAVVDIDACASMSTTTTTTTRDRGDRYGPMEWAQWGPNSHREGTLEYMCRILYGVGSKLQFYNTCMSRKGGPKIGTFLCALTLSNNNRFSKLFHCQNQGKIYNNTIIKDPTTHQVCCYTTLWNVTESGANCHSVSLITP